MCLRIVCVRRYTCIWKFRCTHYTIWDYIYGSCLLYLYFISFANNKISMQISAFSCYITCVFYNIKYIGEISVAWGCFCRCKTLLDVIDSNSLVFVKHTVYSISHEICTRFLLCCALLWLYIDWFSHIHQGLALLTLSWDKNWDSHSQMNGYPSFILG